MFALFRKDRQLSDLHKDLSLDEKTMPHVYDIVTLRQLHKDLLLDENWGCLPCFIRLEILINFVENKNCFFKPKILSRKPILKKKSD